MLITEATDIISKNIPILIRNKTNSFKYLKKDMKVNPFTEYVFLFDEGR